MKRRESHNILYNTQTFKKLFKISLDKLKYLTVIYNCRCIDMRNNRILRQLKKKNPYTGIINCKYVENAIK